MRSIVKQVRRHLSDPQSQHRKIALGFVWVSVFVFVGKLAGAGKEMAIAWRYGVSETVDAYAFVFNLMTWPISVWFNVLTIVLVPAVVRLQHSKSSDVPQFRSELFGLSIIVGVVSGGLVWFGFPVLLNWNWLGLPDKTLHLALLMTNALVLLIPIGAMISVFSAWMLACGQHRNTFFEAIPACVILGALFLPDNWLADPLVWGTVIGFALHMFVLAKTLLKHGETASVEFGFKSIGWQGFWGGIGVMAAGQALMGITTIIDQIYAAGLGEGALATISYANRIFSLMLGMGAMAISRATLPVFSESAIKNRISVTKMALDWASLLFVVGIVGAIVVWTGTPLIVEVIFERGVFSADDSQLVSNALRILLVQLPFYFAGVVLMNYVVISHSGFKYIIVVVTSLLIKIFAIYMLIDKFGLDGLIVSMDVFIMAWCGLLFLLTVAEKRRILREVEA